MNLSLARPRFFFLVKPRSVCLCLSVSLSLSTHRQRLNSSKGFFLSYFSLWSSLLAGCGKV
eukprot:c19274_g1_i1 orf=93-275(-)